MWPVNLGFVAKAGNLANMGKMPMPRLGHIATGSRGRLPTSVSSRADGCYHLNSLAASNMARTLSIGVSYMITLAGAITKPPSRPH